MGETAEERKSRSDKKRRPRGWLKRRETVFETRPRGLSFVRLNGVKEKGVDSVVETNTAVAEAEKKE